MGFNQFNLDQLTALQEKGFKGIELCPPALGPRTRGLLVHFESLDFFRKIKNREFRAKAKGINRFYYGLFFLTNPIFLHFPPLRHYRKTALQFAAFLDSKYLQIFTFFFDISIIPSDFLASARKRNSKKTQILEIRWHHVGINSDRPERLLDFPSTPIQRTWEWGEEFSRKADSYDGFITYSNLARDSFIRAGIDAESIFVVPIRSKIKGLSTISSEQPRERKILFVGRGELDKGLDIAVAVSLIAKIPLCVVGTYSPEIKLWSEGFANVEFLGNIPHEDLLSLMQKLEFYLAPGIESFGYSCTEALASKMKVIGTKKVGVLEWYGNLPNCFLAEELTVESLNSALQDAITSQIPINFQFEEVDPKPYWEKAIDSLLLKKK